ncbi:MAG: PAS domain S-box protein [Methanoregula sp.]|jgi:PAS domain S-box-containing protein
MMQLPESRYREFSRNYGDILIFTFSIAILIFTLYCLMKGITTVFMHLYYFPIILLAYRYHKRGVIFSLWLSLLYFGMVVYFDYGKPIEMIGAVLRSLSFMGVALVVAYLASNLEKRQAQYRALSEFNKSIVTNANVWLSVLDEKGKILVWNRAAEEISGYPADEVISKSDIWKKLYPAQEYRTRITGTIASIIADKRFFENFETLITTKDGNKKSIAWNTRAVPGEEGRFDHFVAIGIDITRRKQAEDELRTAYEHLKLQDEQLRQQLEELKTSRNALSESAAEYDDILRTAMDGFALVDHSGSILDCNDAFCSLIGYSREEMLTQNIARIEHIETSGDIARHMDEILRKGQDRFESQYRKKNGDIIDVEVSVVHSMAHGGRFITFHHNITERKGRERALQHATKRLSLLNFVTFRDIRDAIFVISGYLELEREGHHPQNLQQYLGIQIGLVHDIERWITIAKSFQDLGMNPPVWQNVNQTFLFAISHLDYMHISRSIDVGTLQIYADPALETVFVNLAENVLRHGKTATAVSLRCQVTDDHLTIFFEDNGQGVEADAKEIIFDRRNEKKKGIGLFLAREILAITGITIRETGIPGTGARFEIVVPKGGWRYPDAGTASNL